jgi:hypothetical protein
MSRYFGFIIGLVILIVGAVWTTRQIESKQVEAQREAALAKIHRDYLERIGFARGNPDAASYKAEIQTLLRGYFRDWNEYNAKFGQNKNFDEYLDELDGRGKPSGKGQDKGADKSAERKAVYEYTRKIFEMMRGGTYSPLYTFTDRGVRFDILSASTQRVGGEDKIHLPLVVWGLPREERADERGVKRVTTSGGFKFNWKIYDEKQKLLAEMPGEGGPDGRVDWPDRYIKAFPSMVLLGHYDIDKLPPEAKTAEITFNINARSSSGGEVQTNFLWKLDVPAEWKLGAGQAWKGAENSIRSQEEIDSKAQAKKK